MNKAVPPASYHRYKDVVFPTSFIPQIRTINLHDTPLTVHFQTLITGFAPKLEGLYRRFYDWKYRRWLQAGSLLWMLYYCSRFVAFYRLSPENPATWTFGFLTVSWLLILGLSLTRIRLGILHRLTTLPLLVVAWVVVQVNYEPWLMGHYNSSIPHILGPFAISTLTFGLSFRRTILVAFAQIAVMVGACFSYGIPLRAELLGTIAMALGALLFFNAIQEQQARTSFLNRLTIYNLVTTDGLTGLANRSYFTERLAEVLQSGAPVALIMYDVDDFKHVNDSYGHAAGDTALRMVGAILTEAARHQGLAGRLGGEEFGLFLTGIDREKALALADEIRVAIRTTLIPREQGSFRVTVSGGVVVSSAILNAETLLHQADDLMYRAKDEGRNRIVRGS